jgi:nitroimidazol reductase NimA-like FMN-containing flavoprotein (pyridoxamine 5'-phosphate oxidase superfamily)
MTNLPVDVDEFLSSNSIATIATISEDADYPYVLPVFYITENSNLYFASLKECKKIKNILFHPHIGISITDPVNLKSLQLEGSAEIAEQKPQQIEKLLVIAHKNSQNNLSPLLMIEKSSMVIIQFIIHRYRLSDYSGKNATMVEDNFEMKIK